MKFRKIEITKPNPWQYPSRYPYLLIEGHGKPLSEDENRLIKEKREAWIPSKKAIDLYKLLNSWKDRNALFQLENSNIYYDSPDDHPEPFIAQIRDVIVESVLDSDIAFDQLFIFLSNPRHLNGESIFKEINYDYLTLLELQGNGDYKINVNAVTNFSVEQVSFWKKLFTKKNGRQQGFL